jgi:hypothetical protein
MPLRRALRPEKRLWVPTLTLKMAKVEAFDSGGELSVLGHDDFERRMA